MRVSILTDHKERHFNKLSLYCNKKNIDISYKVLDFRENINDVVSNEIAKKPELVITHVRDAHLANKQGAYFQQMHDLLLDQKYKFKIEHQRANKDQNLDNEKLIEKIEKYYERAKKQKQI